MPLFHILTAYSFLVLACENMLQDVLLKTHPLISPLQKPLKDKRMAQCAQSAKTRAKPHLRFEIGRSLMISQMHSNIFQHHAWHRDGTLNASNCFAKL